MPSSSKEKQREYDSKRAGRTRNFTAVMYPEDLPDDWRERIDSTHVKWIESPLHDKDLNADGQPKKPHHHTLFMFDSVKTLEKFGDYLKDIFGASDTGSIIGVATPQTVTDRCALVRYFAHMDNPEKAQYDVNDIKGHNGADPAEILRYNQSETLEMMSAIEQYIDDEHITEYSDLCRRIRNDRPEWYCIVVTRNTVHFNAYVRSCRHKWKQAEETEQPEHDRQDVIEGWKQAVKDGLAYVDEETGEFHYKKGGTNE